MLSERALFCELKICRMSTKVGSAAGNDDLFMFVEKVSRGKISMINHFVQKIIFQWNFKKTLENVKVRFYELDDHDRLIWEDYGRFTEADVHHQYAIALKTPPYRNASIEASVSNALVAY